jgi:inhibitor of KinA sporulation pathway (predicted exonuclease)
MRFSDDGRFGDGRIVVFDTEFTAWEGSWENGWSRPGEHREIIEIGAILCDGPELRDVARFSILLKPVINPILSDYIQNLTGITNERMAREGVDFVQGTDRFLDFIATADRVLSFGNDNDILAANFRLHGLLPPVVLERFQDVSPAICEAAGITGRVSSCDLPRRIGSPLAAKPHTAIGDACAVLHALRVLRLRGSL